MDVLALGVLAPPRGADDFAETTLFGQQKHALWRRYLRRYLRLPHGPPACAAYLRVFEKQDVGRCNACFLAWTRGASSQRAD